MAPRGPQDDPRRPQDGPKTASRRPKTTPRRLQDAFESKRCLLHLSLGEEISRRSPKMAPKTHPRAPKRPQEAPTSPQEAPKRPPRGPPEVPRGSQKAPKRLPRRLQDAPKAILSKNTEMQQNIRKPDENHCFPLSEASNMAASSHLGRLASHWACNMSPLGCRRGPALRAESGGSPLWVPAVSDPAGLLPQICLPQGSTASRIPPGSAGPIAI